MSPKVSVIVPNYNHGKFLHQRIDSILTQTFTDFELILLDDCSTDNSYEILLSYQTNPKVTAIERNEQNTGSPFKQWENGIMMAQGKYIWIAESDDYADSRFLEYTVNAMEEHPEASVCFTGSHIMDAAGKSLPNTFDLWEEEGETKLFESNEYLCRNLLGTNSIYNASMVLFRREGCLDIAKDYLKMRYCGDWFFWIEQVKKGKVIEIKKRLNYFRQHSDNTTKEGAQKGRSLVDILIIKRHCYNTLPLSWAEKMVSRRGVYHTIKHLPDSKEEKKQFHKQAAEIANVNQWTRLLGTFARIYLKHILRKKDLGKRLL